eukprot:1252858-Lingulodinium_polyedra.AAC.1
MSGQRLRQLQPVPKPLVDPASLPDPVALFGVEVAALGDIFFDSGAQPACRLGGGDRARLEA